MFKCIGVVDSSNSLCYTWQEPCCPISQSSFHLENLWSSFFPAVQPIAKFAPGKLERKSQLQVQVGHTNKIFTSNASIWLQCIFHKTFLGLAYWVFSTLNSCKPPEQMYTVSIHICRSAIIYTMYQYTCLKSENISHNTHEPTQSCCFAAIENDGGRLKPWPSKSAATFPDPVAAETCLRTHVSLMSLSTCPHHTPTRSGKCPMSDDKDWQVSVNIR